MSKVDIKEAVRERYAEIARNVGKPGASCCSGSSSCYDGERGSEGISANLYADEETKSLPEDAVSASLGCGNPTALAELKEGETVLDLGSGGGIDVLLSARRVGPSGKAYGLDMTDDMLALARENQRKAGATNVEFLKGEIEHIPLPDNSVDVIISNCVINLSADKDRVLREAFRVLKPGGRFAVSDVVTRGAILEQIRRDMLLWAGCIAGALEEQRLPHEARCRRLRGDRHRTHAHLRHRGRPRVPDRQGRRRRRTRSAGRGQVHERVRAREEARSGQDRGSRRPVAPRVAAPDVPDTMSDSKYNVLFLCTGNSARSVIAESILRKDGAVRFNAFSAGSHPKGEVNSFALKALDTYGYPTDGLRSKGWDEFAVPGAPNLDFVFTVCDSAAGEDCPVWPGQPMTAHWGIEDPAAVEGSDIVKERAFNTAFRYLKNRISAFTNLPIRSLDRLTLNARLREIGRLDGATTKATGAK